MARRANTAYFPGHPCDREKKLERHRRCLDRNRLRFRQTLQVPARTTPGDDLHRRNHRRRRVRRQQRGDCHHRPGRGAELYLRGHRRVSPSSRFSRAWRWINRAWAHSPNTCATRLEAAAGFISGWMYWWFWVSWLPSRPSPARKYRDGWLPMFEVWQIGLALMAVLTPVNLCFCALLWRVRVLVRVHQGRRDHRLHRRPPRGCSVSATRRARASPISRRTGFRAFRLAAILTGVTTVIFSMVRCRDRYRCRRRIRRNRTRPCRGWRRPWCCASCSSTCSSIFLISASCRGCDFKSGDSTFAIVLEHIGIPGAG